MSRSLLALLVAFPIVAQAQPSYTLFGSQVPATPSEADPNAVTLGLKFYATQAGSISACRIYRGHSNGSGYTCRLYTAAASMLGQVKFPSDAHGFHAGWETAMFASPIPISANTTYIVAYYTSDGDYGATEYGLTNGAMNGPLVAPASAGAGGNGVYAYGSSFHFPTSAYEASNYFVDIDFTPSGPPPFSLMLNPSSATEACAAPGGTVVSTASVTGGDGNPVAYSMTGDTTDFVINTSTGVVTVASGGIASADCNQSYTNTVTAMQQ